MSLNNPKIPLIPLKLSSYFISYAKKSQKNS